MLPRAPPAKKKPCIKTSQQAAARKGGFFHGRGFDPGETEEYMQFFASAITTLQTLVIALGAGLGVWGVVNLLEGYGSDNPGAKSQGMKQFMANQLEQKTKGKAQSRRYQRQATRINCDFTRLVL